MLKNNNWQLSTNYTQ